MLTDNLRKARREALSATAEPWGGTLSMNAYAFHLTAAQTVVDMSNMINDMTYLAVQGLMHDCAHHKQWYLERIIMALGLPPDEVMASEGVDWTPGIAP